MKKKIVYLLVPFLMIVSCKKEESKSSTSNETVSVFSDSFSGPVDTVQIRPTEASLANAIPSGSKTPVNQINTNAKGMNPAHGQPGHRCDIAVGAPLNSPPGKANATKPTTITKTTTISSSNNQPGVVTTNGATITTTNNVKESESVPPVETPKN